MNVPRPALPEGDFRFSLGLRRGSLDFFRNQPVDAEVLAERRRWLAEAPARYAIAEPGSELLLTEAGKFAAQLNPEIAYTLTNDPALLGAKWAPDFLLLPLDEDGRSVLRAGCVCFPSHWDLSEKMGRTLEEIHTPVPTLHETLGRQIASFLKALRPDAVWERWNWGLAATPERNNHPSLNLPRLTAATPIESIWVRFEQQALVRLPLTGAILFAIRIHLEPLPELLNDLSAAKQFAHLLRSMPPAVAEYKAVDAVRAKLLAHVGTRFSSWRDP